MDRKQNEYFLFQRFKMQLNKYKVNNLYHLIKITCLICCVGDLKKTYYGSYASDLTL